MKIDKEKFNKLKQLDRIEFRQKVREIREIDVSVMNILYFSLFALLILLVGGTLSIEINGTMHLALLNAISNFVNFFFFFFILEILLMIIFSHIRSTRFAKLEKEYFSVEVKK